jgi:hypothetical protein
MRPAAEFSAVATAAVFIHDPNHFLRVFRYAADNGLDDQFLRTLGRLMQLLATRGGEIWPYGQDEPNLAWRGCGMVGVMFFHRDIREWSMHT